MEYSDEFKSCIKQLREMPESEKHSERAEKLYWMAFVFAPAELQESMVQELVAEFEADREVQP
jgi:hypothetical protein